MAGRLRDDLFVACAKEWISTDDDGIRALPFRVGEGRVDLILAAGFFAFVSFLDMPLILLCQNFSMPAIS